MIKLNGKEVIINSFPNGEQYFYKQDLFITKNNLIEWGYESDTELIQLMFLKRELDMLGKNVDLNILYLPYSRLDRETKEYSFSLKYIAEFINWLEFNKVLVAEPHSEVIKELLNCKTYQSTELILLLQVCKTLPTGNYLFLPDKGALARYKKFLQLNKGIGYAIATKERNLSTGEIIKYYIDEENINKIKNQEVIYIIDDLCSKGGTFLHCAKLLKENGVKKVILIVTHLENASLNGELFKSDLIDEVIATDSISNFKNDKLTRLSITELIK